MSDPREDSGDVLTAEEDCGGDWAGGAFDDEGLESQRRTDASLCLYRFTLDDPRLDFDVAWSGFPFSLVHGPPSNIGWTFLGMNLAFMLGEFVVGAA